MLQVAIIVIAELHGNSIRVPEDGTNPEGLQLVLNYMTGETQIYASGMKWFENTDVIVHRNQNIFRKVMEHCKCQVQDLYP